MDHGSFDRLTRLLGSAGSRRAAIGALLGTGFAGTLGAAEAAKKDRSTKRKSGKKGRGKAQVSAQAVDCLSPGHGSNISGCDYTNDDFSGQDLSSSRMVGTIFRNADLVETDLSSSNAKNANFRDADMCGADLRSSTLGGANFRDADLTLANLKSSGGCNTANFTAGTTFCGTVMCDGSVRNDDCAGGPASNLCCTPCAVGEECINNECVAVCDEPETPSSCDCRRSTPDNQGVCVNTVSPQGSCSPENPSCPSGQICAFAACLQQHRCFLPCPSPDPCTCTPPASCEDSRKCGETVAARRSGGAGESDKAS